MDRVSPQFRSLDAVRTAAKRGASERLHLLGVQGSCRGLVAAAFLADAPVVAFVADMREAEALEDDVQNLAPGCEVIVLRPAADEDLSSPETRVDLSERLAHLKTLANVGAGVLVILPAAVLLESLPTPKEVESRALRLAVGDPCDVDALRKTARDAGFLTVPMVSAPAEMSIRGDIIDLFPMGEKAPVRVELFDDEVESIRTFDLETQLSIATQQVISIPLVRPQDIRSGPARSFVHQHIPKAAIRLIDDCARLHAAVEEAAVAHDIDRGAVRLARTFLAESIGVLLTSKVDTDADDATPVMSLDSMPIVGTGGGVDGLATSVTALFETVDQVLLFCESEGELRRLAKLLAERDLHSDRLHLIHGRLRSGFRLTDPRTAWLNHLELLGKPRLHRPKTRRAAIPSRAVQNLLELSEGDYVVHLTHGVARFKGMTHIQRASGEEDHLILEFEGETTLYVSASKIDLIQRYVGTDGAAPRLDKIGGRSWAKKKAKVQADLEALAFELLELQAARESREGASHPRDEGLIQEFESSFPYTPTPDQATSMEAIHKDLDGGKPMDRLVCGDVGFGKTEIAVRCAFRVVLGGRQVALLVPTTLLAEQHYRTFTSRYANFPIRIDVLSRFRSKKEQRQTLADLASGAVDILIGTHRLLSKDVAWKDLALVIVDEEQRFGVKAKEALKKARTSVDVLTLTATPIPRTLHMALIGLRDISSLNTPPEGRRAVRTELRAFDDQMVRRAILHELDRGGQVFFIHNRVASLDRIAQRIAGLVPMARVTTAHGQMTEAKLEAAIQSFQEGESEVLVSTNIVESGLDLPRANTIFIDRPDWFGLADLHQLRGRVGRSSEQAYCYLLRPEKALPADAEKRLKAVEELSHLGAGYDLSIKDLEIRGAGNLLSSSQSGHIAAVGYDLFVQLLKRSVARAQGKLPPPEAQETDVDLALDAFLPSDYIEDPGQRMEILRRLGAPDGPDPLEVQREMRDRFGRLPPAARNLVSVFRLKRRCREIGLRRLLYPGKGEVILLDVYNLRRFRKENPFESSESFEVTSKLVHVRLRRNQQSSAEVLALLQRRMLGADDGENAEDAEGAEIT